MIIISLLGITSYYTYNRGPKIVAPDNAVAQIYPYELAFYNVAKESHTAAKLYNWYMANRIRSVITSENQDLNTRNIDTKNGDQPFNVIFCAFNNKCYTQLHGDEANGVYDSNVSIVFIFQKSTPLDDLTKALVLIHEANHAFNNKNRIKFKDHVSGEISNYLHDGEIINEITDGEYKRAITAQIKRYIKKNKDRSLLINTDAIKEIESEIGLKLSKNLNTHIFYLGKIHAQLEFPEQIETFLQLLAVPLKLTAPARWHN